MTRRRGMEHGLRMMRWGLGLFVGLVAAGGCSPAAPADDPLAADPPEGDGEGGTANGSDLDRGVAYIKNEKFDEAIPYLKKATEADPRSATAAFYLAIAHEQTGKTKEAEEGYKTALALDGKLVEAVQNLSALYLDEPPRADLAIGVLNKGLATAPENPALLQNLAYAHGVKGNVDAASEQYEKLLKLSDNGEIRFAYGAMLFDNKRVDASIPHLKAAAEANAASSATVATIASMMGHAKQFGECVKLFDGVLAREGAKKDETAEWLVRRGTCKHELGDEKAASADYKAAIEAHPEYAPAHYYLGLSMIKQQKSQSAIASLEKAAQLGKGTPIGDLAQKKLSGLKKK